MVGASNRQEGQEKSKAKQYIGSFDLLRVVAAIAVIWIHTMEVGQLGPTVIWCRFAVPAFTAVSVFLMALSLKDKDYRSLLAQAPRRAWRIYRLFLIWNVVYLLARLIKHLVLSEGHPIRPGFASIFVAGFVGHLWYLPFLSVLGLALVVPLRAFVGLKRLPAAAVTVLLVVASLGVAQLALAIPVDYNRSPATYFGFLALSTLPSALLAFPVGWLWHHRPSGGRNYFAAGALVLAAAMCLGLSRQNSQANLWHNFAGILLLFAALASADVCMSERLRNLGEMALPVYLVHVLLLDIILAVGHRLHLPASSRSELAIFLATVVSSFVLAQFLAGNRWLAWAVSVRAPQRPGGALVARPRTALT